MASGVAQLEKEAAEWFGCEWKTPSSTLRQQWADALNVPTAKAHPGKVRGNLSRHHNIIYVLRRGSQNVLQVALVPSEAVRKKQFCSNYFLSVTSYHLKPKRLSVPAHWSQFLTKEILEGEMWWRTFWELPVRTKVDNMSQEWALVAICLWIQNIKANLTM